MGLFFVWLVKLLANRFGVIDKPNIDRKIHKTPIPLMGGVGIFIASSIVLLGCRLLGWGNFSEVSDTFIWGVMIASIILMIGGILDDKYNLKPRYQMLFTLAAAVVVVLFGLKITFITNPFGDALNQLWYLAPALSGVLVFFWLMAMMYTTKILDGLDGLVGGISAIASLFIFLLGINWDIPFSATGIWALSILGGCLAFLVFNWYPAKIFLGEGGSIWLGFILGVLSIISGSKIATTLLVVGIPMLDVVWVILQRLLSRQSPFSHADKKHIHFQLLNLGLTQREAVLVLYTLAVAFGSLGVLTNSFGKIIGIVILLLVMSLLVIFFNRQQKNKISV
ncbi:MAG: MraY family glycosyltransferase [bacterium]